MNEINALIKETPSTTRGPSEKMPVSESESGL